MPNGIEVRSWRRVYRPERRIYSIPNGKSQWVIPVTGGIPLWGALYFLAGLIGLFVLRHMPLVGVILGAIPAQLAYPFVPTGCAYLGARWRPDGRMPHRLLASWVPTILGGPGVFRGEERLPAQLSEMVEEEVTLSPGPEWPYLVDADIVGPAFVTARKPVNVERHRNGRLSRALGLRPQRVLTGPSKTGETLIRVEEGTVLKVRPRRRQR